MPLFPLMKETLEKMQGRADAMVISQTPCAAHEREWDESNIMSFVQMIAGTEKGTKVEHIVSREPTREIMKRN